jgi:hypothetical protein
MLKFALWSLLYFGLPILLAVVIAFASRRPGALKLHPIETALAKLARRPWLAGALMGLVALLIGGGLSLYLGLPQPRVHDEFSYLLAADTFAHGRVTNPTHPLWEHFESMHVLQQPTYASKYPPGQGLALAVGQVLGGHPVVGVWLGVALACAALYWMLLAWVPPRWALPGGLLAALHPVMMLWSYNYWGGAVATLGGALVIGSFRRMWQAPRTRDGWILGIGLAVLANSRPYEGMVLSLLWLTALLIGAWRGQAPSLRVLAARVAPPVLLVLALAAGAMGYYNWRVTGRPWQMPYFIHEATYAVAPTFIWQRPRPEPIYRHREIRNFQVNYQIAVYKSQRSLKGFVYNGLIPKLWMVGGSYIWTTPVLFSLLALPWAWRKARWVRRALFITGAFTGLVFLGAWMQPHYIAPAVGLLLVIVIQGLRYLRMWRWRGHAIGLWLVRLSYVFALAVAANQAMWLSGFYQAPSRKWSGERASIAAQLEQDPARHLVIVSYQPTHNPNIEWVYNRADIDGAKVVWAREMDAERNRQLLEYFSDRRAWLLEADANPPKLAPYPIDRIIGVVQK